RGQPPRRRRRAVCRRSRPHPVRRHRDCERIMTAIEISGLRKAYKDKTVLDGIDLSVAKGTVTALLGPNGAGKTTTVHILSTLVRPDGGSASVNGFDTVREADRVRDAIGLTG